MDKQQAERQAQALADEEGTAFFVVAVVGGGFRALPFRPLWGHVLRIVEPREAQP